MWQTVQAASAAWHDAAHHGGIECLGAVERDTASSLIIAQQKCRCSQKSLLCQLHSDPADHLIIEGTGHLFRWWADTDIERIGGFVILFEPPTIVAAVLADAVDDPTVVGGFG